MKVLFVSAEARPFAASGGLADVAGSLPKALRNKKIACRVVMPYYSSMTDEMKSRCRFVKSFYVKLGWRNQYCGLFEANVDGVVYYLLDNEYYFKRGSLYGEYDDGERFAFFSKAVLEMLRYVAFSPDVIHLNDWQTGLVPVYLNAMYRHEDKFRNIKTVFTIHNIQYQGQFGEFLLEDVYGLSDRERPVLEYKSCINVMKGAIQSSNAVTTVSETYAGEIMRPENAFGLDDFLRENSFKISGIVNGIDMVYYNPENDKDIYSPFKKAEPQGKVLNKRGLMKEFGLKDESKPIVAMVTRLVDAKGLDLVVRCFSEMMDRGINFVLLGSGDEKYQSFFSDMAEKYKGSVGVKIGFIPSLAKKIYAGADVFLMPSRSEPCGLAQMVSLLYGTIPVVREVGGLKDTINDCSLGEGNGFTFREYNHMDMLRAIDHALRVYSDKEDWDKLVASALKSDFSWKKAADKYIELYMGL